MKLEKLIDTIQQLVNGAGKQIYYDKKELYLEINSPATRFSIHTKSDDTICTTIYVAEGIYYKFFTERDGILLTEKGSVPDLVENFGLNYIFNILENAAPAMLQIGLDEIRKDTHIFRHAVSKEEDKSGMNGKSVH